MKTGEGKKNRLGNRKNEPGEGKNQNPVRAKKIGCLTTTNPS